ncbi:hypothetical protein A2U01_0088527, partial [Trifolium medium]|nr:hypothetical protein [Trifolium medium]
AERGRVSLSEKLTVPRQESEICLFGVAGAR